jgi:cytochrome bd-type quinol oxidase subunit 2
MDYQTPQLQKTNKLARASAICLVIGCLIIFLSMLDFFPRDSSIVGPLACLSLLLLILSPIFGTMAIIQIKNSKEQGRELAIISIILSILFLLFCALVVLVSL